MIWPGITAETAYGGKPVVTWTSVHGCPCILPRSWSRHPDLLIGFATSRGAFLTRPDGRRLYCIELNYQTGPELFTPESLRLRIDRERFR